MPADPEPNLDPIALQADRNTGLTGFSPRGERAVDLLREEAMVQARADCQPGGGVRVTKIDDPEIVADMLTDHAARLEALGVQGTGKGTMPAVPDQRRW